MKTTQWPVVVEKDLRLDVVLEEEVQNLEVVTVTASAPGRSLRSPQMSMETGNVQEIKNIPVLFGERDVIENNSIFTGS